MSANYFKAWLILLVCVTLLQTCRKKHIEPEAPCKDFVKVKAKFTTEDFWVFENTTYASDSLLSGQIIFRADPKEKYDWVQWKIGTDQRVFYQKTLLLGMPPGIYEVTLIAARSQSNKCPLSGGQVTGIDTLKKLLYVYPVEDSPMAGVFRGSVVGRETDVFDVTIKRHIGTFSRETGYFIKNLNKGCVRMRTDGYGNNDIGIGYNVGACRTGADTLYFDNYNLWHSDIDPACKKPMGGAKLISQNTIRIDYTVSETQNGQEVRVKERFIGIRLP